MYQIRRYLTPWVLICAVVIALFALAGTIAIGIALRAAPAQPGLPTAAIYIIPAPTDTIPVPTTIPLPTPTSTSEVPPPPPAGVIAVGSYVQVTGTGISGLRLHADATLDSKTNLLALDDEVFKITDGPRQSDGYTWWYLVGPYDDTRRGWAVANYLTVVSINP